MGTGKDLVPAPMSLDVPDERELDIAAVYRAHARTVARWAARLGGPGAEVEDIVQEVFLTARRRLRTFEGEASITTWLFRTTANLVRGARRRERVRRLLRLTPPERLPHLPRAPTPLEHIERDEAAAAVYRILDGLPEKQRRVFVLFEMEGMTTEAIAELVGAPVVTVRVWLHRARTRFADELEASSTELASRGDLR